MLAFRIGFLEIGWLDLLDIGLVALVIYQVYNLVRGSVASRVFIGYLLVYLVYLFVKALGLRLMTTLLEYFISVGALALIIIFQQEIRRFLLLIGKSTNLNNNRLLQRLLYRQVAPDGGQPMLRPILETCKTLSSEFSGGLLVLQKNDDLSRFVQSGELLNAEVSKQLLLSIFSQYSPLHDGAVIIGDGRIRAARCILPISNDEELPPALGFRHRAALGMSEATDAAIVAVSEESGRLTLALNGELFTHLSLTDLGNRLEHYLYAPRNGR